MEAQSKTTTMEIAMNDITHLKQFVCHAYPNAVVEVTEPLHADGLWWLDVKHDQRQFIIQWAVGGSFGISSAGDDSYGEGPDELIGTLEATKTRIGQLLADDEQTVPPLGVLLSRLREKCGLTQQALAVRLGISQASVSGFERRKNIEIGTLANVMDALGGKLEIFGVFPDGRYRIDKNMVLAEQLDMPSSPTERPK